MTTFDIVIPSVGRPTLAALVTSLVEGSGPRAERVVVVDDRRDQRHPLLASVPDGVTVVPGRAGGPASARNIGWRAGRAEWVAFLDDDVALAPGWRDTLVGDLSGVGDDIGGSQGRLSVPRPEGRRPTDWERNVIGLETARWATADLAYRRAALAVVGGFDERFRRAFREDADLGARVVGAGWRIVTGARHTVHPIRPADRWVSVRLQAGNADDVVLRALHGRRWREVCAVAPGRRPRHLLTAAAAAAALTGAAARRPWLARVGAAAWLAATAEFAWARIEPGPRTPSEVTTMVATSAVLPSVATGQWLWGWATLRRRLRRPRPIRPAAVLLDRDGTLVHDVPYNGNPCLVAPVATARAALDRLRAEGIPTGVVSNQSGVARGFIDLGQVEAVNRRIDELLGPFGTWVVCPHTAADGCACRKPKPGMILEAARRLGVDPADVAVIGDVGADMEAARAAGAQAVMVPTAVTRPEEIAAAPHVTADLEGAVALLLGGRP